MKYKATSRPGLKLGTCPGPQSPWISCYGSSKGTVGFYRGFHPPMKSDSHTLHYFSGRISSPDYARQLKP